MKFNRLYFGIVFWSAFVVVMLLNAYFKTTALLEESVRVKGKVVDQIWVMKKSTFARDREVKRPQVSYPVGDTSYLFVAHNTRLANGESPEVLYLKMAPASARVYTIWTWIDFGVLVPAFL
jgi:hypothetical protein